MVTVMANQRMYSKKQVDAAMEQSFQHGVKAAREAWRAWYDALPDDLRSAIDQHMAHERQRRAFAEAVSL